MARIRSGRRHPGKNLHRQRRPDAAHADELLEQRLLILREEAVERQRILADVGVDAQPHFRAGIRADG